MESDSTMCENPEDAPDIDYIHLCPFCYDKFDPLDPSKTIIIPVKEKRDCWFSNGFNTIDMSLKLLTPKKCKKGDEAWNKMIELEKSSQTQ